MRRSVRTEHWPHPELSASSSCSLSTSTSILDWNHDWAPPYSTNSLALCDGASLSGCFRPYMAAHRPFTVIPFHVLVTNPNHGLSVSVTRASRHMFPQ